MRFNNLGELNQLERIIPILPCPSIKEQVAFYEMLGFQTVQLYTRPNPYAVMKYGELELHFYGSKKTVPAENSNMCYVQTDQVDQLYASFTTALKEKTNKIPRSGIPRLSKLKDLTDDRRFVLTDVGGNTLFIGTPHSKQADQPIFLRTIENEEHATNFEILYDLLYSKEDSHTASLMWAKFFPADVEELRVSDLDLAKILLVALDMELQEKQVVNEAMNSKLAALLEQYGSGHEDWSRIAGKLEDILVVE
ncbi:hypothetical protein [Paenibacillus glycanilyticus]|uniref:Uncharacterized protein n=1 Tax=Paenibacillus glycanilyticus TaxID=126569 RepID=A0ABQ6GA14_9BACL|nr:hypothetical protein [Paenibacillus glycanilyticus]GLX67794.1 hypothetical protein MU1_21390 [Paenibacillus glycanilyticus]